MCSVQSGNLCNLEIAQIPRLCVTYALYVSLQAHIELSVLEDVLSPFLDDVS